MATTDAYPDWRPIDDAVPDESVAPWDGRPVLIVTDHRTGNRVHRCIWNDGSAWQPRRTWPGITFTPGIRGWMVEDCKHGPYLLRGFNRVTHWMHLPEPPVADNANG